MQPPRIHTHALTHTDAHSHMQTRYNQTCLDINVSKAKNILHVYMLLLKTKLPHSIASRYVPGTHVKPNTISSSYSATQQLMRDDCIRTQPSTTVYVSEPVLRPRVPRVLSTDTPVLYRPRSRIILIYTTEVVIVHICHQQTGHIQTTHTCHV